MLLSLFLLTLMGQCFFSSCCLYEYRLIEKKKTWNEAQNYCRKKHSDLATVTDVNDAEKLVGMMTKKNVSAAWIGLQSKQGKDNRMWHWTLPGVETNETKLNGYWVPGEPNDGKVDQNENCVEMGTNNDFKWEDILCGASCAFICYDDTDQADPFRVINEKKNWPQAQKYCRTNHTDLISGLNQFNRFTKNSMAQSEPLWIGLFRDTWKWSDGNNSSFRNWRSEEFEGGDEKEECAAVTNTSGKWSSDDCNEEKLFFCYDDKVILVQNKMNWEDALYYCQEKYDDLVTITDASEQRWVQARAKNATTSHVWLGLRYTCTLDFWFWVSDEVVGYKNWGRGQEKNVCDMSGAMSSKGAHKWFKKLDDQEFNFICSKV